MLGVAVQGGRRPPRRQQLRVVVVHLLGLLEGLQAELGLVLAGYVPPHRVIAGEGARAERTRHPDALVALPYVRPEVGLVAVQTFAERALQFLSWGRQGERLNLCTAAVPLATKALNGHLHIFSHIPILKSGFNSIPRLYSEKSRNFSNLLNIHSLH